MWNLFLHVLHVIVFCYANESDLNTSEKLSISYSKGIVLSIPKDFYIERNSYYIGDFSEIILSKDFISIMFSKHNFTSKNRRMIIVKACIDTFHNGRDGEYGSNNTFPLPATNLEFNDVASISVKFLLYENKYLLKCFFGICKNNSLWSATHFAFNTSSDPQIADGDWYVDLAKWHVINSYIGFEYIFNTMFYTYDITFVSAIVLQTDVSATSEFRFVEYNGSFEYANNKNFDLLYMIKHIFNKSNLKFIVCKNYLNNVTFNLELYMDGYVIKDIGQDSFSNGKVFNAIDFSFLNLGIKFGVKFRII